MKSIDVELGKSNMLPLIASQQFYASWKVFIRELLLNAWMPAMCGRHLSGAGARSSLRWSRQARCAMSGPYMSHA